jgi:hypothetical protein
MNDQIASQRGGRKMRAKAITAVVGLLVVNLFCVQAIWAGGPEEPAACTEGPVLEKLELGDGVYMPRFVGEQTALKTEPERQVEAEEDPVHWLRVQFNDAPIETIYANIQ